MVFLCEGKLTWTEILMMPALNRRAFAYVKRMQRGETIDWASGTWVKLPAGARVENG